MPLYKKWQKEKQKSKVTISVLKYLNIFWELFNAREQSAVSSSPVPSRNLVESSRIQFCLEVCLKIPFNLDFFRHVCPVSFIARRFCYKHA